MTISVLQTRNSVHSGSASSIALAYSSNLTSGSSLHVAGSVDDSASSFTCADSANGTFGSAISQQDLAADGQYGTHWKLDNSASGADTVTLSVGGTNSIQAICIREIGGTSGYDTHNSNQQSNPGTGTDAITSGSGNVPSVQPGLISAVTMDVTTSNDSNPTAGTGFTDDGAIWSNPGIPGRAESYRYTSTTAKAATFSGGTASKNYITLAALFKETGAGGAAAPPMLMTLGVG